MEQENIQTIIVDTGGDTIKAGFNVDSYPRTVFPNVSGKLSYVELESIIRYRPDYLYETGMPWKLYGTILSMIVCLHNQKNTLSCSQSHLSVLGQTVRR